MMRLLRAVVLSCNKGSGMKKVCLPTLLFLTPFLPPAAAADS